MSKKTAVDYQITTNQTQTQYTRFKGYRRTATSDSLLPMSLCSFPPFHRVVICIPANLCDSLYYILRPSKLNISGSGKVHLA